MNSESDVEAFLRMREALTARKRQLIDEIRKIDEALGVRSPIRARTHRRQDSIACRVEEFVVQNPGRKIREISDSTGIQMHQVATSLTNLTRAGRVSRTREDGAWAYYPPKTNGAAP